MTIVSIIDLVFKDNFDINHPTNTAIGRLIKVAIPEVSNERFIGERSIFIYTSQIHAF